MVSMDYRIAIQVITLVLSYSSLVESWWDDTVTQNLHSLSCSKLYLYKIGRNRRNQQTGDYEIQDCVKNVQTSDYSNYSISFGLYEILDYPQEELTKLKSHPLDLGIGTYNRKEGKTLRALTGIPVVCYSEPSSIDCIHRNWLVQVLLYYVFVMPEKLKQHTQKLYRSRFNLDKFYTEEINDVVRALSFPYSEELLKKIQSSRRNIFNGNYDADWLRNGGIMRNHYSSVLIIRNTYDLSIFPMKNKPRINFNEFGVLPGEYPRNNIIVIPNPISKVTSFYTQNSTRLRRNIPVIPIVSLLISIISGSISSAGTLMSLHGISDDGPLSSLDRSTDLGQLISRLLVSFNSLTCDTGIDKVYNTYVFANVLYCNSYLGPDINFRAKLVSDRRFRVIRVGAINSEPPADNSKILRCASARSDPDYLKYMVKLSRYIGEYDEGEGLRKMKSSYEDAFRILGRLRLTQFEQFVQGIQGLKGFDEQSKELELLTKKGHRKLICDLN